MSQGEWVLLPGLLGLLGMLSFASRVESASLSGVISANEISSFRVCADLCDADPSNKRCQVFCTSRRQFRIQSKTVVGERDIVDVEDTRRDACPTLCQHGFILSNCNCEVSRKKICDIFCEDKNQSSGCPECLKTYSARRKDTMRNIGPGRISRSLTDAGDPPVPRGVFARSDVTGEHEPSGDKRPGTTEERPSNADGNVVDWVEFCKVECARGNGGVACNCDIIP